jgi:hypothetical protein
MNIKEANRVIRELIKTYNFQNVYCRLEPFNDDIYFRLDKVTHIHPGSREINGARFDGLRTIEQVASFRMVKARKEEGRSFFRKNYIRIYQAGKEEGVLKLIINHDVSKVYFKDLIAY